MLAYDDELSTGTISEPLQAFQHSEVWYAFARCMFRSGTIPSMVQTDNGPEVHNCLMSEFMALLSIRHRFSSPYRAWEQGNVENSPKGRRQLTGIMVQDVLRREPTEWSEALPVVDFVLYITPIDGLGMTPRDIDRGWSLATPFERELRHVVWGPV